jgi:hypothetical protein
LCLENIAESLWKFFKVIYINFEFTIQQNNLIFQFFSDEEEEGLFKNEKSVKPKSEINRKSMSSIKAIFLHILLIVRLLKMWKHLREADYQCMYIYIWAIRLVSSMNLAINWLRFTLIETQNKRNIKTVHFLISHFSKEQKNK